MATSGTYREAGDVPFGARIKDIHPGWMIALGLLMILTGMAAIAFPFAATLTAEMLTGSLFLTAGVFTTIHAIMERKVEGMWWELLTGLLYVVAGIVFLANPLGGIIAMTVMLGATFIVEGVFRIIMATRMERSRRLFLLIASGAMSILLGILVFAGLANGASLIVIGLIVGINFIMSGVAAAAVGFSVLRSPDEDATA